MALILRNSGALCDAYWTHTNLKKVIDVGFDQLICEAYAVSVTTVTFIATFFEGC